MVVIRDNPTMSRFEMASGAALAFVEYRRTGNRIVLTHTEVPEAMSGQGVGSKLVSGVLDTLRAQGAIVVPRCEFVAAFIERHPGYRSLVAED
jgi:predicted GNAT family acetyltransferase